MINIGGLVCTKLSIFNDEFALANTVPNKHLWPTTVWEKKNEIDKWL